MADWLAKMRKSEPEKSGAGASAQEKQLLELFNNRNELKRVYDRTLAERAQLLEEVVELRKTNTEMAQRLGGLDKSLSDPVKAQNILVYYGLERLWNLCQHQLALIATDIGAKLEKQEREAVLTQHRTGLEATMRSMDERLGQVQSIREEALERIKQLEVQLKTATGFWNHFKRKKLNAELAQCRRDAQPLEERYSEYAKQLDKLRGTQPPQFSGLSLPARRMLNLYILAAAQQYYLYFASDDLSSMAHLARDKQPHEANYGNSETCLKMQRSIYEACNAFAADKPNMEQLRNRVGLLQKTIKFADADSAMPEVTSLGDIVKGAKSDSGLDNRIVANVLELNSWGLRAHLLEK